MEREVERELIKEAKKGEDEAFTHLFQENYLFLYKYLIKLSLRPDVTEDLIQETMIKAYTHLHSFKGESKFSTWLIAIGSRLYLDQQRKEKRQRQIVEKARNEAIRKMKWKLSLKGEDWPESLELFSALDPELKAPIMLRHYYGYSYPEIAKMLNIKEGTVKSRVHTGLNKIRKEWSE